MAHRFDPAKLDRLNDVARLNDLLPERMWDAFGTPEARVAVEIGAGTGMFAREFAATMPAGSTLYAVDSEPVMLEWLRAHLADNAGAKVAVIEGDASSVPLSDGIADLVYSVNLHHELDDPGAMLAETKRMLRAGGVLGVVDWKREATPKGPPLEHRIGTQALLAQLTAAGFEDVRAHGVLPYHDVVTGRRS